MAFDRSGIRKERIDLVSVSTDADSGLDLQRTLQYFQKNGTKRQRERAPN
jgi:hypothetical protein